MSPLVRRYLHWFPVITWTVAMTLGVALHTGVCR